MQNKLIIISLLIIGLAYSFIHFYRAEPGWDFRNNLWGPVNLLVNHLSPYNIHPYYADSNAIWLPMVLGFLFPLGYISLQAASNLWILVSIAALIAIIVISLDPTTKPSRFLLGSTIFFLGIFPATISTLVLGQISLAVCLALLVAAQYKDRIHPLILGSLLAFALSKPQLSYLFILTLIIQSFIHLGTRPTWRLIFFIGIGIVITIAPVYAFYPHWLHDFIYNLSINKTWLQPTFYSILHNSLGQWSNWFNAFYFVIGMGLIVFISFRLPQKQALYWNLAITTVVSPYIWSWDFVLIFPLLITTFVNHESRWRKVFIGGGYLVCLILSIALKLAGKVSDENTWWIPWFLLITISASFIKTNSIQKTIHSLRKLA